MKQGCCAKKFAPTSATDSAGDISGASAVANPIVNPTDCGTKISDAIQ